MDDSVTETGKTQFDINKDLLPASSLERRQFSFKSIFISWLAARRVAAARKLAEQYSALQKAMANLQIASNELDTATREREVAKFEYEIHLLKLKRELASEEDAYKDSIWREHASFYIPSQITATICLHEGTREEAEELSFSVEQFILELGYEKEAAGELFRGSWVKRIFFWIKKTLESNDVVDRAKAVEDLLFGHASVDVDEKIVDMTAKLLSSLDKNNSAAAIDTGLFLFLKVPEEQGKYQILAKRLTVIDRNILNNDPTLIGNPLNILTRLKEARAIPREKIAALYKLNESKQEDISDEERTMLKATSKRAAIHGSPAHLKDEEI